MPLETWPFHYIEPIEIEHEENSRVFEPIEGDDEVIEDAEKRRIFKPKVPWYTYDNYKAILKFLQDHRLRQPFLFQLVGYESPVEVKIISAPAEARAYARGAFELEFKERNPSPTDFENPTVPGNLALTSPTAGDLLVDWDASTDNIGVTEYEVELSAPDSV